MLRRAFTLLSALSLVLCVATVALEVRSRNVHDQVFAAGRCGRLWWVESERGRVEVVFVERWPVSEPVQHVRLPVGRIKRREYTADRTAAYWSWMGMRGVKGIGYIDVLTTGPPFLNDEERAGSIPSYRSVPIALSEDRRNPWRAVSDPGGGFGVTSPPLRVWAVGIPHALAAAVFAVPPAAWMVLAAPPRRRPVASRQSGPVPRLRLQPHRQRQRHLPRVRRARRQGGRMTRRLPRPSFHLLSALSLLLCAAVVVLWVRSFSVGEHFSTQSRVAGTAVGLFRGQFMIERTHAIPPFAYDPIEGIERHRAMPVDLEKLRPRGLVTDVGRLGFRRSPADSGSRPLLRGPRLRGAG